VTGLPRPGDLHRLHVVAHILPDMLRRQPQRHLPQGRQVAQAKEVHHRRLGSVGHVDFAFFEAFEQLVGRQVDHLDLGPIEHAEQSR
jgi:hypothetical protein